MRARGRPLWFLAAVLGGWTALRIAMLAPGASPARLPAPTLAARSPAAGRAAALHAGPVVAFARPDEAMARPATSGPLERPFHGAPRSPAQDHLVEIPVPTVPSAGSTSAPTGAASAPPPAARTVIAPAPAPPATLAAEATPPPGSRLRVDTWLVARGGREDSLAFGELGASQAGVRLTYALDAGRRFALSARASAPLHGAGSEVAAGLDWRPTRLPVHLLVEDRYDLDARQAEPAAELIAGLYARAPLGLTLDAYAQGGAVRTRGAFADGAARLFRAVALTRSARLELGAGGWGGAQRGAARLDLGPSASLAVIGHGAGVRLGADYRLRVAGAAVPGSGPALTLGAGF